MKQKSFQIFVILMAVVVMFSTMSFNVSMHYCGEQFVDYSLTQTAKTCGMEIQKQSDCDTGITQKSCCSDKTLSAKGHDDLKPAFHSVDLDQQLFITSFIYTYALLFEPQEADSNAFLAYSPPPLIRDVQTLDQVFRI
ncbi:MULTISPECIES: hypothetical protein [unclassified Leeuwenhoekiella]|uniref:HYC_CC_PP family protein n=1 Tax=unclassified Leeuwenhoekiella TaxID=2615029 RepID=UPI0025C58A87|nr:MULTISPECIES: hypothetical protein [unclassified Leeuwenhoekiella]|tara:strand:- start:28656 stop:29069 length:414 start_codon:yes stop_codon:yes gene_type:complete